MTRLERHQLGGVARGRVSTPALFAVTSRLVALMSVSAAVGAANAALASTLGVLSLWWCDTFPQPAVTGGKRAITGGKRAVTAIGGHRRLGVSR